MTNWQDLKATHKGRVFILGNGPSLRDHPLKKLIGKPTIGVNRSYMLYNATYHVVPDLSTFSEPEDEVMRCHPWVFSVDGRHGDKDYAILLKNLGPEIAWSFDMEHGVYPRFSVYMAMQLAAWMGFDEIVLLGVDLCERNGKGHFYDKPMARFVEHQQKCFKEVARIAERWPLPKILNCSDISKLEVFPMVKFEDVVNEDD